MRWWSLDEGFVSSEKARTDDDVEGGAMIVFEREPRTRISSKSSGWKVVRRIKNWLLT